MALDPILIVGAGPTGLNLALALAFRKVPYRLISDAKGPGEQSRAMVVHARTLEFYDQYGFADKAVGNGIKAERVHLVRGDRQVADVNLKDLGGGISPFPFALAFPQDDHERLLIEQLETQGGGVEWETKLTDFTQDANGVRATLECNGKTEEVTASYIAGCDGAHSRVREVLNLPFAGGVYQQSFFVTDVQIDRGFERDIYIHIGERLLVLLFPVRSTGMQRLIGLVPPELADREDISFEDLRNFVEPLLGLRVTKVNWFSKYRVHHRVTERFRVARAFVLGDAGHVHSPVGAQGMNTGIGDAVNLGWKLAHVCLGRASESVLDSYEPERIGFARALVSTTDRAFTPLIAEGMRGELVRQVVAPFFVGILSRVAMVREEMFRLVSQAHIHYSDSPLSEGKAGDVHGGDRLPWTARQNESNFAPLRSLDWQAHVYGAAQDSTRAACDRLELPVHEFAWDEDCKNAGFKRDALYVIRPDGYIGLALSDEAPERLEKYVRRLGLRFGKDRSAAAKSY